MGISPVQVPGDHSSQTIRGLVFQTNADVLILSDPRLAPKYADWAPMRLAQVLRDRSAGMAFGDSAGAPRIDHQKGSIRDDFDLGPLVAVSVPDARGVLDPSGPHAYRWGGLYDLRLRLSERCPVVRVPEALSEAVDPDARASGERGFDYVDPRQRDYQAEMEAIATAHLRRVGAWLPEQTRGVDGQGRFPVAASVVIPVRNRASTIADAIRSALAQDAPFDFNVIVVDNHSTDLTAGAVAAIADPRVIPIVPRETYLGIGGCWNAAVFSPACGSIAVQLDSDDLFSDSHVLARLVGEMREGRFAMLVGAYTTVDFELNEIPPGVVNHREWTRGNGHNNALRINGLGAPRVYDVGVLRGLGGFPNVSYGEDYAVGLRISREYALGRIFDSLYLCRRWEGNTDSRLDPETLNRFNAYKDWLRSVEIEARIELNRRGAGGGPAS